MAPLNLTLKSCPEGFKMRSPKFFEMISDQTRASEADPKCVRDPNHVCTAHSVDSDLNAVTYLTFLTRFVGERATLSFQETVDPSWRSIFDLSRKEQTCV